MKIADLKDAIYWPHEDKEQRPVLIKILDRLIEEYEKKELKV